MQSILYVGLDVHANSIAAAVVDDAGREVSVCTFPNRRDAVRKFMRKLGEPHNLRVCYEAGPCGFALYRWLREVNVSCRVVAPTLIPTKAGDRVKTDRRDAMKLARYLRTGDLTFVWVPDEQHEALRDLVRARNAAKQDEKRARERVRKFLLRQGLRAPDGVRAWTSDYFDWLDTLRFEHLSHTLVLADYVNEVRHSGNRLRLLESAIDGVINDAPPTVQRLVGALQCMRGVARVTAVCAVAEIGSFSRFQSPQQLMAYAGLVPSEFSSGGPGKHRRGRITKTGNSHLRRVLGEAAWSYRFRPAVRRVLAKRQQGQPQHAIDTAWKAQVRLCTRYRRLSHKGKPRQKVVTAIARELLAFMWAIAIRIEGESAPRDAA